MLAERNKGRRVWDFSLTDYNGSDLANTRWLCCPLGLGVSSPVDDVTSWGGDVDGVQDGPQYLAEWSGRWKEEIWLGIFELSHNTVIVQGLDRTFKPYTLILNVSAPEGGEAKWPCLLFCCLSGHRHGCMASGCQRGHILKDRSVLHSRGEDFRRKVCDVGGDGPACQELSHLVGEGVAVVLKQAIPVTSEPGQNRSQFMRQVTTFMHRD